MSVQLLPQFIQDNYDIHEWRHALAILRQDFPTEYEDICDVLTRFRLRKSWLTVGGGRKSKVSEWIDSELLLKGWVPKNFDTRISIDETRADSAASKSEFSFNRTAQAYDSAHLQGIRSSPSLLGAVVVA